MNIRLKVKLSFVVIIVLLFFLGFISLIITYQVKENSTFRENLSSILVMQEGMNDIILESTQVTDVTKLEQLHTEFLMYEKNFEALRAMLSLHSPFALLNALIVTIGEDKMIQTYLKELYANEHHLELMFDDLFRLEREKLEYMSSFNALYPEEKRLRLEIQETILRANRIEQIKALGDLRYYSKETLYQHGDAVTLQKWLSPIDLLIQTTTKSREKELHVNLLRYKETVRNIADQAIKLEQTKSVENKTIADASQLLDENKNVSLALEKLLSALSNEFMTQMRFMQGFVGIVTVVFILFLSIKVSRNVSLSMDEVEAKVEEGLVEVNALNQEIEDTQKEVLFTMGAIGETRSRETGNHVKRVAEYSKILALHYGLDEEAAEMLKLASPMHDIGKIGIPDGVLNKPGKFDEAERRIMDTHAMLGYEMLKHSKRPLLKIAAIVAKEHHEKYDGTGYPEKKKGEEIHIYGRITALADVFDALGSARVYKPAWEDEKIFALFKAERGKQFDPKLIDIFFEHVDEFLHVRETMRD